jgi:hypothetical protein
MGKVRGGATRVWTAQGAIGAALLLSLLVLPISPEKAGVVDKGNLRAEARTSARGRPQDGQRKHRCCGVRGQSLKDRVDYAGSVSLLRFHTEAQLIYTALVSAIKTLVADVGSGGKLVDAVEFVGGEGCLPDGLCGAVLMVLGKDTDVLPGEPTETLVLGCTLQLDLTARFVCSATRTHSALQWTRRTVQSPCSRVRSACFSPVRARRSTCSLDIARTCGDGAAVSACHRTHCPLRVRGARGGGCIRQREGHDEDNPRA